MCKIIFTSSPLLFNNHTSLFRSKKKRTRKKREDEKSSTIAYRDSNVTAGSQGILEHEQNEH